VRARFPLLAWILAAFVAPAGAGAADDPVLRWNAIALAAVAQDHGGPGPAEQGGPTRAARALAIVHASIHDAANAIAGSHEAYRMHVPVPQANASLEAAVAKAAHHALATLYPAQAGLFDAALEVDLAQLEPASSRRLGVMVGKIAALGVLHDRHHDGSEHEPLYAPGTLPGEHREDPLHPGQGFLGPGWGSVRPFALASADQFRAPPPPALGSIEYAAAFAEVKRLGGDGLVTPTERTPEQTEIGVYWAYDGTPGLGPPPRLYNQIARVIAEERGNTVVENARLFALVNIALADAGIACWESKYFYGFWRPILGIREADPATGPSGVGDGNPFTAGDTGWTYLGAPASNRSGRDFTPPFPAYPSGHATFGAALFRILERFYGTDAIPFTFTSDELDGATTDSRGNVRPFSPRSFATLGEASTENAESRIYLGIHWRFDAVAGMTMGSEVADWVFDHALEPLAD
jgi:hypothetical protein